MKKVKKLKKGYVLCPDCGNSYEAGMPHMAFCKAHTCDICESSYGYVVGIQDRKDTGKTRVCNDCVEAGR